MRRNVYDDDYYKNRFEETKYAAKVILESVLSIYSAKSAIDFGCGVGTFLKVFKELTQGTNDTLGLDGDYVNRKYLAIDSNEFKAVDLRESIVLDRRFDLAISMEVAEHLPESRAKGFVKDLCNAADFVLFSAAGYLQGGDGHINEQRLSYWVKLFREEGYILIDTIRPAIWDDKRIPAWYRQNTVCFYRQGIVKPCIPDQPLQVIDIVHPDLFEVKARFYDKATSLIIYRAWRKLYMCLYMTARKVKRMMKGIKR